VRSRSNVTSGRVDLTGGDRWGEGKGKVMSAGHSLRRQNYSFVHVTPPNPHMASASEMHRVRVILAVVIALVVNFATVASISMLIPGR
jgi:hypothetical protein